MTRAKGRRVMSETTFGSSTDTTVSEDEVTADVSSDTESTKFYNVFDGTDGRPEGSYLDIQERISAEKLRAMQEDREPDLSDPGSLPAATGTPLVTEARQVDNKYFSNPATVVLGPRDVDPVTELNVDVSTGDTDVDLSQAAQIARERQSNDNALLSSVDQGGEPSDPGVVETGPAPDQPVVTSQLSPEGTSGGAQY